MYPRTFTYKKEIRGTQSVMGTSNGVTLHPVCKVSTPSIPGSKVSIGEPEFRPQNLSFESGERNKVELSI